MQSIISILVIPVIPPLKKPDSLKVHCFAFRHKICAVMVASSARSVFQILCADVNKAGAKHAQGPSLEFQYSQ